ncbi:hypothetical protein CYLTODRAFT_365523 [Cylindrobasidium torrendii FP15055 ss-10]|uniref:Eukaryotic mitochondrial regulator protein-domain-containing protein n=1 Tax=Cylindrobasidium torrendii FP15055 ss-10 TaxID=1314674 RepID=A0A0D7BTK2_9AGAR|nr:hypothetical protein CYLTODRAFT_365523 [Cylindrobasidium torrendii FP15055 ss-10]
MSPRSSSLLQCLAPVSRPRRVALTSLRRGYATEAPAANEKDVSGKKEGDEDGESRKVITADTFQGFMAMHGDKFRKADVPCKWLGDKVPFPLNPTFRPPPPLSDAVRDTIWKMHMRDPVKYSLRELARLFHMSIGRVDAILRMKGMEKDWVKDIPLQTGFLDGMEFLLKVDPLSHQGHDRHLASESDELEEQPDRSAARDRYERHYWEATDETNPDTIMPGSIESAKARAKRAGEAALVKPGDPRTLPRVPIPSYVLKPRPIQRYEQPGRPDIKFVDVGNKFVDGETLLARYKESERRVSKNSFTKSDVAKERRESRIAKEAERKGRREAKRLVKAKATA